MGWVDASGKRYRRMSCPQLALRVIAGNVGRVSYAYYHSFGTNNRCYAVHLDFETQNEERDRVVARVEGKHDLYQCCGRANQPLDALIDFPPQHPAVAFVVKACLNGARVLVCPVDNKNGSFVIALVFIWLVPLMRVVG